MRRWLAVPVICAAVVLAGCAGEPGAAAQPPFPSSLPSASPTRAAEVSVSVLPDSIAVTAGDDIGATVKLKNLTGHAVPFSAGLCNGKIPIGIASDKIPYDPAVAAIGCAKWMLPAAGYTYRGVISTRYGECLGAGGRSLDKKVVRCNPDNSMPALPPGRYRVAIAIAAGATDGRVVLVDPVTVTLTR